MDAGEALFATDVTLALPFDGLAANAVLFWQMTEGSSLARLPGQVDAGLLSVDINTSGRGFVGDGIDFRPPATRDSVRMRTIEGRVEDPGLVGLFFTVDDCDGNPISNLTGSDFRILEDKYCAP